MPPLSVPLLIKLFTDIPAAGAVKWSFDRDNNTEDKVLNQSPCANLESLKIRKLSSKYSLSAVNLNPINSF